MIAIKLQVMAPHSYMLVYYIWQMRLHCLLS